MISKAFPLILNRDSRLCCPNRRIRTAKRFFVRVRQATEPLDWIIGLTPALHVAQINFDGG
jgi:hypothetical protein